MSNDSLIRQRVIDLLTNASEALARDDADGKGSNHSEAIQPPAGLADRTLARLADEGLLRTHLADRTIDRLRQEGLLAIGDRQEVAGEAASVIPEPAASALRRRISIWLRPITSIGARLAAAAGLMFAMGLLFIPETADRVEPVERKLIGKRAIHTLYGWGDAILDRWSKAPSTEQKKQTPENWKDGKTPSGSQGPRLLAAVAQHVGVGDATLKS